VSIALELNVTTGEWEEVFGKLRVINLSGEAVSSVLISWPGSGERNLNNAVDENHHLDSRIMGSAGGWVD
jgi:hypothetical protein